jgi:hypothetical protein
MAAHTQILNNAVLLCNASHTYSELRIPQSTQETHSVQLTYVKCHQKRTDRCYAYNADRKSTHVCPQPLVSRDKTPNATTTVLGPHVSPTGMSVLGHIQAISQP